MIPLSPPQWQTETWQQQLSGAFRSLESLLAALELDPQNAPYPLALESDFPLRVPQAFVARMERGNWQDPLLLQVLPQAKEQDPSPGYSLDPLAELNSNPVPGLIHKYHGRVLLVASPACAVHCRYCFRRHFPYEQNQPARADWQQAMDYISERDDISEVILSGGDPLALSDVRLEELVLTISKIPHIKRLRIHSRLPMVLPDRLSKNCISILSAHRLQTVFVIHCNHPNEIDAPLAAKLSEMRQAGITLLNQTVLLKDVNNHPATLCKLSEKLFNVGVLPYYLHVLDRVQGAAHFETSDIAARALHVQMMEALPGYLVPKLVREDPECAYKVPL
jgi:EF-P beta-lysylation protein EpmB